MSRFQFNSAAGGLPVVVKNLLIINILFFVATWVFASRQIDLINLLGVFYFDSPHFRPWQLITHMFMHGGWEHILFNMFALYMFGSVLENVWGPRRFLIYYLLTGLGAISLQMAVQAAELYSMIGGITIHPDTVIAGQAIYSKINSIYAYPMVGASGAIFGLLIAFAMLFPNAELFLFFIPIPVKAKYLLPTYILLELYLGVSQFSGDTIAHFAHLGGALVGFIILKTWNTGRPGRLI